MKHITYPRAPIMHAPILILSLVLCAGPGTASDLILWYRQPAATNKLMEEALPLGNGRMGCMLSGGIERERIQFNEQSLWSGDNNWDGEYECGDHGFGAYRHFGDLTILWRNRGEDANAAKHADSSGANAPAPIAVPVDYRRALDIATGIHRTTFTRHGIAFSREAFASRPH